MYILYSKTTTGKKNLDILCMQYALCNKFNKLKLDKRRFLLFTLKYINRPQCVWINLFRQYIY